MIPSALDHVQEIAGRGDQLAVFLDYDGTLTPIVSHPEKALLSDSMRQTLQALAAHVSSPSSAAAILMTFVSACAIDAHRLRWQSRI